MKSPSRSENLGSSLPAEAVAPALSDFVFGGYVITRPITTAEFAHLETFDDQLVTASDCLAVFLPDAWTLSWTHEAKSRDRSLAAFGINPVQLDKLVPLVDDLFNRKRLLWARFMSDWEAVEAVLEAAKPSSACRVLGLGIHADLVSGFIEDAGELQDPESTLVGLLSKRLLVPEGGSPLGFEILGFEAGCTSAHSWLCNLQRQVAERHGVHPELNGLLSHYQVAKQWADEITREQLAEPVLWLPWLVVEYPAPSRQHGTQEKNR